jgi:hypothetical protein
VIESAPLSSIESLRRDPSDRNSTLRFDSGDLLLPSWLAVSTKRVHLKKTRIVSPWLYKMDHIGHVILLLKSIGDLNQVWFL